MTESTTIDQSTGLFNTEQLLNEDERDFFSRFLHTLEESDNIFLDPLISSASTTTVPEPSQSLPSINPESSSIRVEEPSFYSNAYRTFDDHYDPRWDPSSEHSKSSKQHHLPSISDGPHGTIFPSGNALRLSGDDGQYQHPSTLHQDAPYYDIASQRIHPNPTKLSLNMSTSMSTQSCSSDTSSASKLKKASALTNAEKRSNHILSEQKRRDAIRVGFKDLVELLQAGESVSGISVNGPTNDKVESRTGKQKGKGRGRKGDASAGASKSALLGQGVRYIKWLERGNEALLLELKRYEELLKDHPP